MLLATQLERKFRMEDKGQEIILTDPDEGLSPEAVLNFYSNSYPLLTTATIAGPTIQDDAVWFEFKTTIGTKG
ncbi:PRTRC system protein C [Algoriphagus sp. Y33]|uniref:PRTRC system protein C n=1 Tax=Algoriphagus sp. Y33 TaxID=2772483 RepID=UPI00177E284D|nr:PRTRC system protein C [Algoriphagus sp. Y33]